ncbi:RNA polymerase sigma-70 factor (ECF subfamily) [Nocardia tenerifensis]|uniref:RNA polymerase sigma-70 factor (ECF subfamily) n=1 Tax=Nocardia tenerifensis TaxID=228006 RepID=A0A318KDY8_9NOCA|nr:ECF RNA polymerase sigma factor SigK [Nocardia tenerifensis]PXX71009.1 RNA polymerase sigma-70 factor (ECF subfamily) [Nocardia tenerifensis]
MPHKPELAAIRLRRNTGGGGPPACSIRVDPDELARSRRLIELLDAVATGDREAFTEFYRATSHRVFGLALRILRAHAAAEEITQEVYLQAWSLAAGYDRKQSSPMGWLMMLTHRRAVDRVRREESAATREIAFGQAHLGRDHDVVAEEVGQLLDEQSVLDCLDTLTTIQREAVALAYYSGRTYSEVADHLEVPLPTIKSRIRDGLKRLEDCLTGSGTR